MSEQSAKTAQAEQTKQPDQAVPSWPTVAVSACLAGVSCRYDGKALPDPGMVRALETGQAMPFCPEVMAGLGVPRAAAEIRGGDGADVLAGRATVVSCDGRDLTAAFVAGARAAADVVCEAGISTAVLQARSPSCGCGRIYDGQFTGNLVAGDGVFTAALKARGITVRSRRGIEYPD